MSSNFDKKNFIDITGVDFVKLVQKVYELSSPLGLGHLHYKSGKLSKKATQEIVDNQSHFGQVVLSLDYVIGRACKFTVWKDRGKLLIRKKWFDHSEGQLKELVRFIESIKTKT